MSEENSFGDMLNTARRQMGWTQQVLADKFDTPVNRVTVNRWEQNIQHPSAYHLEQLVAILGLNGKESDALYRAAGYAPPIIDNLPPIDNLPFRQNPFFTGRETQLYQLRKQLQETGTAAITQPISISGLGGIGKTELALEYAHRFFPDVYSTALWVNAADTDAIQASYSDLTEVLKLPERNEQNVGRRIQAVKNWLKMHTNWLLIMDNADDLPLAESFLPSKSLGHVVFTTRSQSIGTTATRSNHIKVEKMESDDGLLFLLLRSHTLTDRTKFDKVASDIRDTAREVVELLGGYPLALDQAGAYIEDTGVSFTDYIKRYNKERRRLLNRRRSRKSKDSEHSRHPLPVAATLDLSIKEACKGQPLASDILHLCMFLQPDAIPEELFQHDESFKYNTTEFDEAIEVLHSYSLIKRNSQAKTLSMHRLVQAVLIDDIYPEVQKHWRERVVRALNKAFPEVEFHHWFVFVLRQAVLRLKAFPELTPKEWVRCDRLLPLVLVCAAWTEDELTPTEEVAELFQKAGAYLSDQCRRYPDAEPLLELSPLLREGHLVRLISIWERLSGTKYHDTATEISKLAVSKQSMNSQAALLLTLALSIRFEKLGVLHLHTIDSMNDLANFYIIDRKYEMPAAWLPNILAYREMLLGPEHPDTATTLDSLATLFRRQGKFAEAEVLLRRVLAIREKHFGPDHPIIVSSLDRLAILLQDQGKDEQEFQEVKLFPKWRN